MKRGLISACAALLVGSGWVMAQAPQPVDSTSYRPVASPIRQVQAVGQDLPGGPPPGSVPLAVPSVVPNGGVGDAPATPVADPAVEPRYVFWASADYLLWRINYPSIPAIAGLTPAGLFVFTTSTTTVGIGGGTTTTLNPSQLLPISTQSASPLPVANVGEHSGARFTMGLWFDPDEVFGIEGRFFLLEQKTFNFANSTNANPNANSFVINTGLNSTLITTTGTILAPVTTTTNFPVVLQGNSSGNLSGFLRNEMLGAELNARTTAMYFGTLKIGGLAGPRYMQYDENFEVSNNYTLTITSPLTITNPAPPPATLPVITGIPPVIQARTFDQIQAHNRFYGGQVGMDLEATFGQFFVAGRGLVALGDNEQSVKITGFSAAPTLSLGGATFGSSDIGNHSRSRISVIPELNFKVGYLFTDWCRGYVGYDGMIFYNTLRAAGQNTTTAPLQVNIGGTTNSASVSQFTFQFRDSNVSTQGINFGLEFRF